MRLLFPIFLVVAILAKDAILLYSFHSEEHFLMEAPIETSNEEGESEPFEIDDQIYDEWVSIWRKSLDLIHQNKNYAPASMRYTVPELDVFSPPPELLV
jgi:hypothetical protein